MTPRRRALIRNAALALVLTVLATGCNALANPQAPQSTVFPKSDWASEIYGLYNLVFILAIIVFVGVEGALLLFIIRYRRRPDNRLPSQTHGNTRLEILWTVLPAVVLFVIAVPSIQVIFASDEVPANVQSMDVKVIGHQWWWEFQYPDLGITTANELHLPAGQTARFDLQSADVIHSFWFPFMGGKTDVVPMRVNHMWYTPDANAVGEYESQCVEFCGTEHAMMRNHLFVDTPEQFTAWVALQKQDAQVPQGDDVQRGAGLVLGGQCRNCHTIKGTPANGLIGPNLTHVGSRTTIVSGTLDTNIDNLAKWIHDPQSVKPGAKMPTLGFNEADTRSMAAYLMSLK